MLCVKKTAEATAEHAAFPFYFAVELVHLMYLSCCAFIGIHIKLTVLSVAAFHRNSLHAILRTPPNHFSTSLRPSF